MAQIDMLLSTGGPPLSDSSDGGASLANETPAPLPEKEVEPAPVETSDDEDVEEHEAEEQQAKPEKAAKTPTRRDKGIAKILAREKEAKAQLQQALDTIRALAARQTPPQPQQAPRQPASADDPKPQRNRYDDPDQYVEAYAQWAARGQVRQALAAVAQQQQQQSVVQSNARVIQDYSEKVAKAAQDMPDWTEVAQAESLTINPVMGNVIMRLENGPEVQYYLGKNPKEAERISRIGDLYKVAAELGRISEKIQPKSSEKQVSAAPKPVRSKAGTASPGSKRSIYDPELSMAEYVAMRKSGNSD
jgi:hypothetical protein